jgi:hypothetical protein
LASHILLFATLQYLDPISDTLAKSVVLTGVLGLTRLDLWWRNGTADYPGTRWRFFSPFTGGSVLFIPVCLGPGPHEYWVLVLHFVAAFMKVIRATSP